MKKQLIILGIGMLPWIATHAQQQDTTLIRTVVVENEYNPTVMDASKINVLPKVEEPTVPKTHIDYASSIRPVSAWNYQTMQPIVKEWKSDAAYRGYLSAGYGNNGNVDLAAGYLWDISKRDRLNVSVCFFIVLDLPYWKIYVEIESMKTFSHFPTWLHYLLL